RLCARGSQPRPGVALTQYARWRRVVQGSAGPAGSRLTLWEGAGWLRVTRAHHLQSCAGAIACRHCAGSSHIGANAVARAQGKDLPMTQAPPRAGATDRNNEDGVKQAVPARRAPFAPAHFGHNVAPLVAASAATAGGAQRRQGMTGGSVGSSAV